MSSPSFKGVSLLSIGTDDPLPFRLAIYFKGRYLMYRTPGQALDAATFNRFIYKRIIKVYIPQEDAEFYDEYQRKRKAAEDEKLASSRLSADQKFTQKLINSTKPVIADLFSAEGDQELEESVRRTLEFSRNIVNEVRAKPYVKIFEHLPLENTVTMHSVRVSILGTYLAYQLGYVNPVALEYMAAAALLHDIGKTRILLPDDPVDATVEHENLVLKDHPEQTCEVIKRMGFVPEDVTRIIREHHEFWDGTGTYGIKGNKIYGLSRIFCIVNNFDNLVCALTGDKQERAAEALRVMSVMKTKFDPKILSSAIKHLAEKSGIKAPKSA